MQQPEKAPEIPGTGSENVEASQTGEPDTAGPRHEETLNPNFRDLIPSEMMEEVPPGDATERMTLSDAVRTAEGLNPTLREADAVARAARARAYQAGLYPNPFFFSSSPQWSAQVSQYNWVFGQDIVTKGKLRLNRGAASRLAREAELAYRRARFDVLTAVRQSFYLTLLAQRRVVVLQNLVALSDQSRDTVQKLQGGGETARPDVVQMEIELQRAQVALQNAEALLRSARRQLSASIGQPDLPIADVTGDINAFLPDFEHEALARGVVTENYLAQIAQVDVGRTQIMLRRAIVEPFPNVNLQGGIQYSVQGPYHNQGYAQIGFIVPLWNRNQGEIRAAQNDIIAARARLGRVQNELANQAALALGNYQASAQLAERYRTEILPRARESYSLIRRGYVEGEFELLRLLVAQRTLIDADLGYVNAQEARWLSAAEIAGLLQVEQFPP